MKVTVDRDRCIGAGLCALTAPDIFDQDPAEALVIILDETPPETAHPAVLQAIDRCPASVIQLR